MWENIFLFSLLVIFFLPLFTLFLPTLLIYMIFNCKLKYYNFIICFVVSVTSMYIAYYYI